MTPRPSPFRLQSDGDVSPFIQQPTAGESRSTSSDPPSSSLAYHSSRDGSPKSHAPPSPLGSSLKWSRPPTRTIMSKRRPSDRTERSAE